MMWSERLRRVFLVVAVVLGPTICVAQGSAGTGEKFEPRVIVDMPTAGMLGKGSLALDVNFYQEGGALLGLTVGVFDRLEFGVSYGGSKLIGADAPVMNSVPGFIAKIRVIEENIVLPALAVGFDSQGKDGYIKDLSRYVVKSPGFFLVVSKNYAILGFLSLHGGLNYSLERADGSKNPNAYVGIEKTIGPFVSALAEYNMAANDGAVGKGRGYLNAAIRWSISGGLTLGMNLKDLLKNKGEVTVANRTVTIEYIRYL